MTAQEFKEKEAAALPEYPVLERDLSGVELLRTIRGVRYFEEMPKATQEMYLKIAACFPENEVWACGSRVRGDYIEASENYEFVKKARRLAFMAEKETSDFDFWTAKDAKQVGELPEGADRCNVRVPDDEKILIPYPRITHKRSDCGCGG